MRSTFHLKAFFTLLVMVAFTLPVHPLARVPAFGSDATALDDDSTGKKKKKSRSKKSKKGKKKKSSGFSRSQREAEFKEKLGGDFKIKRTKHFFVLYSVKKSVVEDSTKRLEKTYDAVLTFVKDLKVKIKKPKEKLPIILCRDFAEYERLCQKLVRQDPPREAAGLYFGEPYNFCIFYDVSQSEEVLKHQARVKQLEGEAASTRDRRQRNLKKQQARDLERKIADYQDKMNRSVVQHEVAHELLFNFGVHVPFKNRRVNPLWLVEGMATHFEPAQTGRGVDRPNRDRLRAMCEAINQGIPNLRQFLLANSSSAKSLTAEDYGWSWLATHFLIKRKKKAFPEYVALVRDREPGSHITPEKDLADFEASFGPVNADMQKKWEKFVRGYLKRVCK